MIHGITGLPRATFTVPCMARLMSDAAAAARMTKPKYSPLYEIFLFTLGRVRCPGHVLYVALQIERRMNTTINETPAYRRFRIALIISLGQAVFPQGTDADRLPARLMGILP